MIRFCFFISLLLIVGSPGKAQTRAANDTSVTKQATFAGGPLAWKRYLERNLNARVATEAKAPPGIYRVKVQFLVDEEGNVSGAKAVSVPPACLPCGVEAVRIIQASPQWMPARENGRPVAKNQVQQIAFMVVNDSARRSFTASAGPILVHFENLDLTEAIRKAAVTGKIVFAQFISDKCEQCNEAAEMAMRSAQLAKEINDKCIAIEIGLNYNDRREFTERYNPSENIGTYFISADGDLLSRFPKTTSRASEYIDEIGKAIAKQVEGRATMTELNAEWKNNPDNFRAMELNLQKRLGFGWATDSLLDIYTGRLPADSLQSKRVLLFIAAQAPSLFSKANQALRKDWPLFNEAWYSMPLAERRNINSRIVHKSLHKAIDNRSENMAKAVVSFSVKTYTTDTTTAAQREHDRLWLSYYRGVKDTAAFLQKAIQYYDRYYMSINVSDVNKRDSINMKKALDTARSERVEDPNVSGGYVTRRDVTFKPFSAAFARELVNGASMIYSASNDSLYLQKALVWARRANDFKYFADVSNTYSKLLYITGNKAQAIASVKQLIQKLKLVNMNATRAEALLAKMETNAELTDRLR